MRILTIILAFALGYPAAASDKPAGPSDLTLESRSELYELANKIERLWELIRSEPTVYSGLVLNNRTVVYGLPPAEHATIRRLTPDETAKMTFRHYTKGSIVKEIVGSGVLKPGRTAYVKSPFVYVQMLGVFLTTPATSPDDVGLDESYDSWVDVKVDPVIPVFYVERGIYLIPGAPEPQPWMAQKHSSTPFEALEKAYRPFALFGWRAAKVPVAISATGTKR